MFGHQDNQNDDLSVDPLLTMDNQARAADSTKSAYSDANTAYSDDNAPPATATATATAATPPSPTPMPPANDPLFSPPSTPPTFNNDFKQTSAPANDGLKAVTAMPYDEVKPAQQASTDDLMAIKEQALQQLDPLMDHLDQTPEEKFRTTMMMIQAADNKLLIPSAYQAAQQIKDDKARAQALLDVVNEINYFSQHDNN
ncbi:MAG: hypothetical protein ABSB12_00475 [Candidatus Saccharimonadales bacterium]|jgi:hypothetical protein